ncbi:hypothetical protein FS837_011192 [Tulasnella sp. UAMH 9824]|nr:hypothetical protein FS837_011192 [Tulasnella sp. UAMH 9824]
MPYVCLSRAAMWQMSWRVDYVGDDEHLWAVGWLENVTYGLMAFERANDAGHKESSLEEIPTLKTLKDLPSPTTTSVSIITPPKVTLGILQEAKALGVPALWLQPGAEDDEVRQYVNDNLSDRVILGGPCILVSGDKILESLTK